MLVVNLFGTPGAGKTSGAAYVFSKLKMAGVNAELASKFAKDKVWEESKAVFHDQLYIFGKQHFKLSRLKDKVDVVITDAPLLHSIYYNNSPDYKDEFNALVQKVVKTYENANYFIHRVKPYNPAGRFQTEPQAGEVGNSIYQMLQDLNETFTEVSGDYTGYDYIVEDVLRQLRR